MTLTLSIGIPLRQINQLAPRRAAASRDSSLEVLMGLHEMSMICAVDWAEITRKSQLN